MTISVIIPVYNVEQYIERCLDSVMMQHCDGFTIECILVDDCSPDRSMDIVRKKIGDYQGDDISFTIIRHEVNKGLSAARNSGIVAATGEFLYFLDSDDMITENAFKSLLSYFFNYFDVDMVMGNTFFEENSALQNETVTDNCSTPVFFDDNDAIMMMVLRRQLNRYSWNKLIKRAFILKYNLFFDVGLLYEDVTWSYRLFSSVSSFLLVPAVTYIYKYNPSSIVHTHHQRALHIVNSFSFISDYIFNHPPIQVGGGRFYSAHRLFVYYWMMHAIDCKDKYEVFLEEGHRLESLKRDMIYDALRHFHPLLAAFFLTMFSPWKSLLKYSWFRRNVDRINKMVFRLSW